MFPSEKGRLIKDPAAIATTMNDYFAINHRNHRTETVSV